MGSVVVSDVLSDFARYSHTRMVGSHHDAPPPASDRRQSTSTARSHSSSNPPHPQQRYHSPALSTSSASRSSPARSTRTAAAAATTTAAAAAVSSAPIDVPSGRGVRRASEEEDGAFEATAMQTSQAAAARPMRHDDEGDGFDRAGFPLSSAPRGLASSPPSPQLLPTMRSSLSLTGSGLGSPARIKVRDLNHIQAFASEEALTRSQHPARRPLQGRPEGGQQQYEISSMPVTDIIEMVAGLLTKITTTNDRQHQHENIHRHLPNPEGSSALNQQTASVLSFHGKNIPSITILSYLSRIHKYCPTTYEVFLSLLVYFDRMTEIINKGTLKSFQSSEQAYTPAESSTSAAAAAAAGPTSAAGGSNSKSSSSSTGKEDPAPPAHKEPVASGSASGTAMATPPSSGSIRPQEHGGDSSPQTHPSLDDDDADKLAHVFVVDSFNIHRLVIAGVTCASKFFSDVFYTNSRYAKVGGLPIHELNHLELQFLLLNDFRLSVPVEELDAYGSMLVEFYAQEVIAQQMGSSQDALYMQTPNPTP